jgi:hypothetical protein
MEYRMHLPVDSFQVTHVIEEWKKKRREKEIEG